MEYNVFEAPKSPVEKIVYSGDVAEAEEVRQQYLNYEANIGCIGALFVLGGGVFAILTLLFLIGMLRQMPQFRDVETLAVLLFSASLFGGLAFIQIKIGLGLIRFERWARITSIALISIGLILNLLGTIVQVSEDPDASIGFLGLIFPAICLAILASGKSKVVFSPEYQQIVQKTPHLKRPTAPLVWFFLLMMLGGMLLAILLTAGPATQ